MTLWRVALSIVLAMAINLPLVVVGVVAMNRLEWRAQRRRRERENARAREVTRSILELEHDANEYVRAVVPLGSDPRHCARCRGAIRREISCELAEMHRAFGGARFLWVEAREGDSQ